MYVCVREKKGGAPVCRRGSVLHFLFSFFFVLFFLIIRVPFFFLHFRVYVCVCVCVLHSFTRM